MQLLIVYKANLYIEMLVISQCFKCGNKLEQLDSERTG